MLTTFVVSLICVFNEWIFIQKILFRADACTKFCDMSALYIETLTLLAYNFTIKSIMMVYLAKISNRPHTVTTAGDFSCIWFPTFIFPTSSDESQCSTSLHAVECRVSAFLKGKKKKLNLK